MAGRSIADGRHADSFTSIPWRRGRRSAWTAKRRLSPGASCRRRTAGAGDDTGITTATGPSLAAVPCGRRTRHPRFHFLVRFPVTRQALCPQGITTLRLVGD